jgi:hypothetical protein
MLSLPFPYFPAFVELVDDGGLESAGDISLVVLIYKVNNNFSKNEDRDNTYTFCDFCLLDLHALPYQFREIKEGLGGFPAGEMMLMFAVWKDSEAIAPV